MSATNDGGPAFQRAVLFDQTVIEGQGMTLRDYFAGQALAGDLASQNALCGVFHNDVTNPILLERAEFFYRLADAMLQARGGAK